MSKKKSDATRRGLKKNIWSISGLTKRVQALIVDGALKQKNGEDELVSTVNAEFGEQIVAEKLRPLSRTALHSRLDELIGTPKVNADLWKCHGTPWMMKQFREMHPYIPETWTQSKLRERKGITKSESIASFKAGMGRVDTSALPKEYQHFTFPDLTYQQPLVVSQDAEGQVPVINGALIGIKYPDIEANPFRRAQADARKRGATDAFMTNILDVWTKRTAGYLAVYRAKISGIKINPDRFEDPEYAQTVRDILDGKITDEMIYMTLAQRLEEMFDGLHKLTHRMYNQGPEFPGRVHILLGLCEEEIIYAMAYYEARYRTILKQADLRAAVAMASRKKREAEKANRIDDVLKWDEERKRLARLLSAAIITDHTGPQYEELERRMRSYVVWRLESTIPNAKVIGQGHAYLRMGRFIVKLTMPEDAKVKDSHLAGLGNTYGAALFRNELPDLTLSCPLYSLNPRSVGREDSVDGQAVTKHLAVASSCVDGAFLREEFKHTQRVVHPVQKLVRDPQFKPGVTFIRWNNDRIYTDDFPIERLGRFTAPKDMANFAYPYPGLKYLTAMLATDWHFGGADRRQIYIPEKGIHMGATEACIELMRCHGVLDPRRIRVHMFDSMDDLTNGDMWFRPGYRPDPNRLRVYQFERWQNEMLAQARWAIERGDTSTAKGLMDEIGRVSVEQMLLHGEEFPFHQMEQVFKMHIEPNLDFYSAVLGRWVRSGATVTGVSAINRTLIDTRDLGVANFGTGNHRIRTLDGKDLEGDYVAQHLRALLGQRSEWQRHAKKHPNFLEEAVRAPRFGGDTFGWGLLQAPGAYTWGFRMHGSPARQSGWSDILAAVVKSDIARGDDTYGLLKYVTVTVYGDKHFYASVETERLRYFMCAAGVHTNHYGSVGGFPPNNTGPAFLSIPVDGPQAGPILFRPLPHDFLRDWFAKKPEDRPEFKWDTFLPEAA